MKFQDAKFLSQMCMSAWRFERLIGAIDKSIDVELKACVDALRALNVKLEKLE